MTGSEAIRRGVKQGVDDARMSSMLRELVDKIGADPGALLARVEALEAENARQQQILIDHHTRLERHRIRIRWLERWAHIHWPGWFPSPRL